jgi:stage II sporulation protein E
MADYLMELSDHVAQRLTEPAQRYSVEVAVYSNRIEADNGDRCIWFMGTGCKYYVLMCDGMGTGLGAVDEGKTAATLLKKLLCAGFPAKYALRTLNSLCVLRGRSGAVTADLAEISLDSGKATLYKWGAAPSYLLHRASAEKIGTAGPPPGLSVTDTRETAHQLSLRRGETLVLVSDGVGEEEALHCCATLAGQPPGDVAAALLACGQLGGEDDATVVVIRLEPGT